MDEYIRKAMVFSEPVRIRHCVFVWTTVLSIDPLLVHVNAAMYVASLEEVEVRGDVGAWVLDGNQLVEGDDHEFLLILLLICFFKGGDGEVAGGSPEGGAEAGRQDGTRREKEAGLPRRWK